MWKSLRNLRHPLLSVLSCQPESKGSYNEQLPTFPCGLLALVLILTSVLSKCEERKSPSDCNSDKVSGHPFTGPKLKLQDFDSESCAAVAEEAFLGRQKVQDCVWRCLLDCAGPQATHFSCKPDPFFVIRAAMLQLKRVARESSRNTVKGSSSGWMDGWMDLICWNKFYKNKFYKKKKSKQIKILKPIFDKGDDATGHKQK